MQTTRPPEPHGDGGRRLVSVVVPARNEQDAIGPCLDSILAQTYEDLEVLVVDGASTDRTAAVVEERAQHDPRVRLVDNPDAIIPAGLNRALAAARGTWLVRVDAHATIPPGYVQRCVGHLATGRWGGVGGRKDGVGYTPAGRGIAAAMASPFGVGNSTYHHGTEVQTVDHIPFGAYPVALARELGGWDERLRVNQDFEFDYRVRAAGHELLFDPGLRIDWESRQNLRALWRQYHRYGRGKVQVMALHPGSTAARHLVAPAFVATLGLGLVSALVDAVGRRPLGALLLAAVVVPYVLALSVASVVTAREVDGWTAKLAVAPAFVAMHVGWGLGWWRGIGDLVSQGGRPGPAARRRAAG